MAYKIISSTLFKKNFIKLTKNNPNLIKQIDKTLVNLSKDPYSNCLRTHQVNIQGYGKVKSSKVTDDLRIIWKFKKNGEIVIVVLKLCGHSGKNKVYK